MPKPQYNVKLTDTRSKNYNKPAFRPVPAPPKVNPLKNWWNSVVNNARQNAFNQVNNWENVAPNVPAFNTKPAAIQTDNIWNTTIGATPQYIAGIPTAYGTNTRRGNGARVYPTSPNLFNTINNINRGLNSPFGKPSMQPKPNQNAVQQYSDTGGGSVGPEYMSLNTLVNLGYVDPNASDPYEIGGSPYQQGVWVRNPELPPYQADLDWAMAKRQKNSPQDYFDRIVLNGRTYAVPNQMLNFASDYPWDTLPSWYAPPADFTGSPEWKEVTGPPADNDAPTGGGGGGGGYGGGGGGGGGGGSYDYFSRPSSPSYTGYGGNGYASMPQAPNYTGYGRSGYELMPQAPTYRGRGGRNQSSAPATAYYRGINSGGGYGGGYAGGQSQRSAWYGALLQWNI